MALIERAHGQKKKASWRNDGDPAADVIIPLQDKLTFVSQQVAALDGLRHVGLNKKRKKNRKSVEMALEFMARRDGEEPK